MLTAVMGMAMPVFTQGHHMNVTVPHAPQGNQCLLKKMHSFDGSLGHNRLKAVLVIQMGVQAGDHQIMVFML
jgi:hypothetical protein